MSELGSSWVELEWGLDPNEQLDPETLFVAAEMANEFGGKSGGTNVKVIAEEKSVGFPLYIDLLEGRWRSPYSNLFIRHA